MKASQTVQVALGDRSYEIQVGGNLLPQAGSLLKPLLKRPLVAIVTDENVAAAHLTTLEKSFAAAGIQFSTIVLPAGEATKNYATFQDVTERLLAAGIERNDTLIALGGGVIGDLTGFVASVLRRGISFVQIPTSLLAQVDSSVGGKTAINSAHGKNLVGAFHQPMAVLADVDTLSTLPKRELLAGYAEVVKYGLLGDAPFFDWLEDHGGALIAGDIEARTKAIVTSCEAKAAIVAADEKEAGQRALLNLGHTFGHALEAATGYSNRLLHGEGIAIGMVLAFQLSEQLSLAKPGRAERISAHLASVGLPTKINDIPGGALSPDELMTHMSQDKKVIDGALTLILAKDIGHAFITREVDHDTVLSFLTDMVQH